VTARLSALAWLAVAVGLLGAGAIVATALRQGDEDAPVSLGERPVAAVATVSPAASFVGDRIEATLELTVNRDLANPDRIDVQARFRPFTRVEPVTIDRRDASSATVLRYTYVLQCIDRGCVARLPNEQQVVPGRAFVRYEGSEFGISVLPVRWPPITVASRLAPDTAGAPTFRAAGTPPAPSAGVDPTLLGWLLAGAAAALVLAVAVTAFVLLRRAAPTPVLAEASRDELPPLERALAALERVRNREESERRVALEELARVLEQNGNPDVVDRVRRLAWSRRGPSADEIDAISADVRPTEAGAL
jgi:hypothetical protein